MRKTLLALTALLGLLVASATPAAAITGNYVKDFEHPYVGLLTTFDADGEFAGRCSGSLLTPTVFLTAGHCTRGRRDRRRLLPAGRGRELRPRDRARPGHRLPRVLRRRHARRRLRDVRRDLQLGLRRLRRLPGHQGRRAGHPRPADRAAGVRVAGRGRLARQPCDGAGRQGRDLHGERLRAVLQQPGRGRLVPRAADGVRSPDEPDAATTPAGSTSRPRGTARARAAPARATPAARSSTAATRRTRSWPSPRSV